MWKIMNRRCTIYYNQLFANLLPYLKTVLLFAGGMVIVSGIMSFLVDTSIFTSMIGTSVEDLQRFLIDFDNVGFFIMLLQRNIVILLVCALSSVIYWRLIPMGIVGINALVLPLQFHKIVEIYGSPVILGCYLHAGLELLGMVVACAIALYAMDNITTPLVDVKGRGWNTLNNALIPFVAIVLPLIVVAAFIESFISVELLKLLLL